MFVFDCFDRFVCAVDCAMTRTVSQLSISEFMACVRNDNTGLSSG